MLPIGRAGTAGSCFSDIGRARCRRGSGAYPAPRRFWIPSPEEFDANGFSWSAVREVADNSLAHVSTYSANGSLLRPRDSEAVFVIYGGYPFGIPSESIFEALGFEWQSIFVIPAGAMNSLRKLPDRWDFAYEKCLLRRYTWLRIEY